MPRNSHEMDFERDDGSTCTVEYTITPFISATWDDPSEGGEVEILRAYCDVGELELTEDEERKFSQKISEEHDHDEGPDPDDERDRLRDRKA